MEMFSPEGWLNQTFTAVNDVLWAYLLIGALLACGLYFTVRSRGVQFRMLGEMVRLLGESAVSAPGEGKHISTFQAFAVSIATRVGTGNLAGVASAIAIGGPGAVFWMWLIAVIGSATSFVESTLAQLFKSKAADSFIGGPAYYIRKGLHSRWMSHLFAVLLTITFGLSYNSIQSNTICGAMNQAFGISPLWMGVGLTVAALAIVFGGIQRIARVSSVIVPVMAVGYFVLALYVVITHIDAMPHVLSLIVKNAFGFEQAAGGTLGTAMMIGIKRGLFSNEAGEGSSPNVAATACTSHPVKQGLVQALGVFTDTLVVCSCTAFIVLVSGLYTNGEQGIMLTQSAMSKTVGAAGPVFVAVAIFLFAFSSIIGNYYYGEANIRFITHRKDVLQIYRVLSGGVMVMFGALASLDVVWSLGDLCMALLTLVNLVAIVALSRYAWRLLDDYRAQKRRGVKSPVFHKSSLPEIAHDIDAWE